LQGYRQENQSNHRKHPQTVTTGGEASLNLKEEEEEKKKAARCFENGHNLWPTGKNLNKIAKKNHHKCVSLI